MTKLNSLLTRLPRDSLRRLMTLSQCEPEADGCRDFYFPTGVDARMRPTRWERPSSFYSSPLERASSQRAGARLGRRIADQLHGVVVDVVEFATR
jgi:hypothetical protein